jgi:hypothetical protein
MKRRNRGARLVAAGVGEEYILRMARDRKDLDRIATELASLTPEERAQVIARASVGRPVFRPPPKGWRPPVLSGGGTWTGGNLTREEIYDDDGR